MKDVIPEERKVQMMNENQINDQISEKKDQTLSREKNESSEDVSKKFLTTLKEESEE
jgi:hypothetical protein